MGGPVFTARCGAADRGVVNIVMSPNFQELLDRSIQNLGDFLNIEVDLGITFARIAMAQHSRGDADHYEASKQNAIAALAAIDRFKDRLPHDLRTGIEARRCELAQVVSTL